MIATANERREGKPEMCEWEMGTGMGEMGLKYYSTGQRDRQTAEYSSVQSRDISKIHSWLPI